VKKKLKILILIRDFGNKYPKHKQKFDLIKHLESVADVYYWHEDGSILNILKAIDFVPDFILHYDISWGYTYAPDITDLDKVSIPKGCFVIDVHWDKTKRLMYFIRNHVDLIFSITKNPFLNNFPQFKTQFRWVPFSINPSIFKDWKLNKNIKFLLMGLVNDGTVTYPEKGRYKFREAVLNKLKHVEGFKYNRHPGHFTQSTNLVNEKFSQELNRSEIFFTCGAVVQYPVSKYFEALGSRTLLLAEPNPDILELGFKDGENFVACTTEDFFEKAMYYSANKEKREKIMDNGYDFVHKNHTNDVRAKQIISYIDELIKKERGHES
jgi:hypothetical protein